MQHKTTVLQYARSESTKNDTLQRRTGLHAADYSAKVPDVDPTKYTWLKRHQIQTVQLASS